MGLLRKLAQKVIGGAKAVHAEANHPGQPPPHKASQNPFYEQPEERIAHQKAKEAAQANAKDSTKSDQPWFLDGSNDGWDDTNPDKKKD